MRFIGIAPAILASVVVLSSMPVGVMGQQLRGQEAAIGGSEEGGKGVTLNDIATPPVLRGGSRGGAGRELLLQGTCVHDPSEICSTNQDCDVAAIDGACDAKSDNTGAACSSNTDCPPNERKRGSCIGFVAAIVGECDLSGGGNDVCGTCADGGAPCTTDSDCPSSGTGLCSPGSKNAGDICTADNQCKKGTCAISIPQGSCVIGTCAPTRSPTPMPSDGPTPDPDNCTPAPSVSSMPTGPTTYLPGAKQSSDIAGLHLSVGLTATIIATSGQVVNLVGGTSTETFHYMPDGADVIPDEGCSGGYTYVSNSESGSGAGGVGAISFNAAGEVIGYKTILSGTTRNCSGGRTPWGTWVSCEENGSGGKVYEVHPKNNGITDVTSNDPSAPQPTLLGTVGRNGGNYEGVAFDDRTTNRPIFFLTEDSSNGPLERFQPSLAVLDEAYATGDFSRVLYDNPDNTAQTHFLVLDPTDATSGIFTWTSTLAEGEDSAALHYQNCEGIDVRDGMLYMTCKADKQFFTLDLDAGTYIEVSTVSASFTSGPDQIRALANDGNDPEGLVYFCEDVSNFAGIHARDATNQYYTIAQDEGSFLAYESTGLAFSPDRKHMYVAFQGSGTGTPGHIYDITREDGRPFGGSTLSIQYHGQGSGGTVFS